MGKQETADDDADDIHQHLIIEYVCADIDPEAANDNNDEHQSLPDISNENCENNCDVTGRLAIIPQLSHNFLLCNFLYIHNENLSLGTICLKNPAFNKVHILSSC
jgi:hypothetical protein